MFLMPILFIISSYWIGIGMSFRVQIVGKYFLLLIFKMFNLVTLHPYQSEQIKVASHGFVFKKINFENLLCQNHIEV